MRKIMFVFVVLIGVFLFNAGVHAGTIEKLTADGPIMVEARDGGAAAAKNEWIEMTDAGYHYEPGRMAIGWRFAFLAKTQDIVHVEIWDVSKEPSTLIISDDKVKLEDNVWMVSTELKSITFKTEPWIVDKKKTEKVFKIILTYVAGEKKTLYQWTVFTKQLKDQIIALMKGNYIHVQGRMNK
jgi:hypothetical protein